MAGPLLAQLSGRFTPEELGRVRSACEFGARWHEGQWRKSGDRYITHPLAVAEAAAPAGLASRLMRSGRKALHWLLRSEARPWALLAPLTAWIVVQTAQGNAGSAVVTVITLPPVLAAAVKWLRDRLGITQRNHDNSH